MQLVDRAESFNLTLLDAQQRALDALLQLLDKADDLSADELRRIAATILRYRPIALPSRAAVASPAPAPITAPHTARQSPPSAQSADSASLPFESPTLLAPPAEHAHIVGLRHAPALDLAARAGSRHPTGARLNPAVLPGHHTEERTRSGMLLPCDAPPRPGDQPPPPPSG